MAVGNKISNEGFWLTDDESGHCFDIPLATELKNFFNSIKCNNVLDLGCGPGHYTKYFLDNNIECEGWDGNPNTHIISKGLCKVADLTKINEFEKKDWVLSLEVGEHIPKKYETTFIQNLINHSKKGIILSWATPGQPGDGHVNCQSNEYVIDLMRSHNYILDVHSTIQLRDSADLWWFKNTLMVFRKKEMEKITFCIPSKNNLRYLKSSIASIKTNSTTEHEIVVYVDVDDDGTEEWLVENKIKYLKNETTIPKGIAHGYNRCIEAATTDIVCMFHADMYMAKGFDTGILKYIKPKTVVSGTRIEPPLHPQGLEKIVKDFGMYPEDFNPSAFDSYVEKLLIDNKDVVTKGIFAPWAVYKENIVAISMHDDALLHSYYEDSDMFNRLILAGYDILQTWEAYAYHLTCRGGQFQDGIESVTKDAFFHEMKNKAFKNYLRKWGSWIRNDEYQYPSIPHKYNVAFVIKHCNFQMLEVLEPWCDRIYLEDDMQVITDSYIQKEQSNTTYDLKKRVLNLGSNYPEGENDIVVVFDGHKFTNESYRIIQNLSDIITESGEVGTFELDIFKITINSLETYEHTLIKL